MEWKLVAEDPAVFKVLSRQCFVQEDSPFPSSAGHATSDADQDAIGLKPKKLLWQVHHS